MQKIESHSHQACQPFGQARVRASQAYEKFINVYRGEVQRRYQRIRGGFTRLIYKAKREAAAGKQLIYRHVVTAMGNHRRRSMAEAFPSAGDVPASFLQNIAKP